MARMHCKSKGVSESTYPYNAVKPSWLSITNEEATDLVLALSKKGYKPSEIGKILRDEHAIGRISTITGKGMLKILRENDQVPTLPEDLEALVNKRSSVKNHLAVFKNDKRAKYNLGLIESKMHRLARYFKRTGVVSKKWKPSAHFK